MDTTDDPLLSNDSSSDSPERRKCQFLVLEPAVLLLYFSIDLSGAIFQNQIIYQTCTEVFGYNETDCELLGTPNATKKAKQIETLVQPYVANIFMVRSLLDSIIPAVGTLFIGPWSDMFGRKPVILASFIGHSSLYILWTIIAFSSTKYPISPWYYILAAVPKAMCGSSCTLKSGVYSYISDVTDDNNRGFRMAVLEAFLYVGVTAGYLSSGPVYKASNTITVFGISSAAIVIATLWITFLLNESVEMNEMNEISSVGGLFRWTLVKDMFKSCFKKRSRYDRLILWLMITALTLHIFIFEGSANVFFLFVREKFMWTVQEYTIYQAMSIIIQVVGNTLIVILFQKILGFSAISMALLAFASCTLDSVVKATAYFSWHLYLAAGFGILKGLTGSMCRTIMSTFIPANEIGKIFAFISSVQAITPLGSAPLYTEIYRRTLNYNPGAYNIISFGLFFICFTFLSTVFGILKTYSFRGSSDFINN